jgi:hypothetical protein
LCLDTSNEIIANIKVGKIPSLVLPNHLLNELFGFGNKELSEHLIFNVPILRIEAFHSPLLHARKYTRDVYAALLYLSTDLTLFNQLLNHLFDLLLFNLVGLRQN